MAGKLTVSPDGRITGPASIAYNDPFPCANGEYGSGAMMGVVMHTMVGNLPGTIAEFNNPSAEASAHFGIDQAGGIHQFGPIGKGWCAWAQEAGNHDWYSIEHADNGNPDNPLTAAQITASAQLVEVLSRFAGFPLQESDSTGTKGYGVHNMGGANWGGHTCPDVPPAHVRSAQRAAILAEAREIRVPVQTYRTVGGQSLTAIADAQDTSVAAILRETIRNTAGGHLPVALAAVVNTGDLAGTPVPEGVTLYLAGTADHAVAPAGGFRWVTAGKAPLGWLATTNKVTFTELLEATIGKYGTFDAVTAVYLEAGNLTGPVIPRGAEFWVPAVDD